MPKHSAQTYQHVVDDERLVYADESTLLATTPSSDLFNRFGYATSERTFWLWTQDGWLLVFDPQAGPSLSRAVVFEGDVVTYEDEIVWI
jgi:hypothetical protein